MTRASTARRIASAAAYGGGGIVVSGATVLGVMVAEAALARRAVGETSGTAPDPSGTYEPTDAARAAGGASPLHPLRLVVLGDSSAAGFGVESADDTPGGHLGRKLADHLGRPVHTTVAAQVGAQSVDLAEQLDAVLDTELDELPDVAVMMIGANDVLNRVRPAESVRHLAEAVRRLHDADVEVVVGTCPDLGTVQPIRHPLRLVARRWSRALAAAQTIAVVEGGGRTVALADLLGEEFARRPHDLFGPDQFHPSAEGYAAAADALLPSVCAAVGVPMVDDAPTQRADEEVLPVAEAAAEAVEVGGTAVSGAQVDGRTTGTGGLWAAVRRIPRPPTPPVPSLLRRGRTDDRAAEDRTDASR